MRAMVFIGSDHAIGIVDTVFSLCSTISLADGGLQCGEHGLFVGDTPVLRQSNSAARGGPWEIRPTTDLNRELSARYGLPIEVASKRAGFLAVANALQHGDLALAQIAALLLQFPAPPSLAKVEPQHRAMLAGELLQSRLLKGDWDPDKHPRIGTPPNRSWFAPKPHVDEPERQTPESEARDRAPSAAGEALRRVLEAARKILRRAAQRAVELGEAASWIAPEIRLSIESAIAFLEAIEPTQLNIGEQQAIDQARASLDPPKTLKELQTPPNENVLGYEQHHIVEQNPGNLAKDFVDAAVEKFGRDVLDDPRNIVWVPRLKHELITSYYNSRVTADLAGRIRRRIVNEMDFDSQYEFGLRALRIFGVLQ